MGEIEIVNESPLTLVELRDKIEIIKKKSKELNFRANKTNDYLGSFAKDKGDKIIKIKKKLQELDIVRLKDKQITKIIDFMPIDAEQLKVILSTETLSLKQEDLQKILECLKQE